MRKNFTRTLLSPVFMLAPAKKQLFSFFLFAVLLFSLQSARAQGLCTSATQIFGNSSVPSTLINNTFTNQGYNLGALSTYSSFPTRQMAKWVYCVVTKPGVINMNFGNTANGDFDWGVWGPFAPGRTVAEICANKMDNLAPIIVDNTSGPGLSGSVTATQVGQIYIILMVNWPLITTNCNLNFSGTGSIVPANISATGTLSSFTTCQGTASSSQSFTVSGSNLYANLITTAPTGFEISLSSGGTYSSTISLTPVNGTIASTPIFVRLISTIIGFPVGNITVASSGGTTQKVAVSGTTIYLPTVTASSNSPVTAGETINLSSSGADSYTWSGPNSFSATGASAAVTNSSLANAGVYSVTGTSTAKGCTNTATTSVVVNTPATGLNFDGQNDYVEIPVNAAFNTASYTAEALIKPSSVSGTYRHIFGKRTSSIGWNLFILPSGNLALWNGYAQVITGPVVTVNTWMHVAVTGDATGQKLYLNGVLVGSTTSVMTPATAQTFRLGLTSDDSSWPFAGSMDEVRIWNRALCQLEIQSHKDCELSATGQTGLVALYHFNQGIVSANNGSKRVIITYNTYYGADIDVSTGWGLAADESEFDPITHVTMLPAPAIAYTILRPSDRDYIVTYEPATELLTAQNFITVDLASHTLTDRDGFVTPYDPNIFKVYKVTSDLYFIDTQDETVTLDPVTLNIVAAVSSYTMLSTPYSLKRSYADANNLIFQGNTFPKTPAIPVVYQLTDALGNNNGTMQNFALTSNTSNWIDGKATGNCTVITPPTATITGAINVCINTGSPLVTFTGATGTAPYTFTYTINGGAQQTVTSTGNTATVSAPTNVAGTFTYTLVSVKDASTTTCSNTITGSSIVVVVRAIPTATITAIGSTSVCPGSTVSLQANAGTGFTYQWSKDAVSISGATAATYNATATGSYTVVITNSNGCVSPVSNALAISVADVTAPQFTSLYSILTPNVGGVVTATGSNGASVFYTLPSATDNCTASPIVTAVPASGSIFSIGTTIVTVTATDATGNSTTTTFNIIVSGTAPVITVPANSTLNATSGQCTATANFAATESTGIPSSTIAYSENGSAISSGTALSVGVHTITATATNSVGSSTGTFTVTVKDIQAPSFSGNASNAPASILANVPEAAQYQMVYQLNVPNAGQWSSQAQIPYTVNNAAALAGASFNRVAYYMELDNGKWVWVSMDKFTSDPSLLGIPTGSNVWQQKVNSMNVFASANAGVTTGTNITTGNIEIWSHCYSPANTLGLPGANASTYDFDDQIAGQNCYGSFQVHNYGAKQTLFAYNRFARTDVSDIGIGNNTGNVHPDWTYMQNAAGVANKKIYVFISGGVIADINANTDLGLCSATVNVPTPAATDLCGSTTVTGVRSDALALTAAYPKGTTTITWTATDASSNSTTTTQKVIVTDNQAPVIAGPVNITAVATSAAGAVVTYATPTATDNCPSVTVAKTVGLASGSTFPIGVSTITYKATDAAGLTASYTFTITVAGVAPIIVVPSNIVTNTAVGLCSASVTFTATETTGVPASTITYKENAVTVTSGSAFSVGVHTITATATNAVSSSTKTFTITVNDVTPPQFTSTASIITSNIAGVVQATSANGAVVMYSMPSATDNCAGSPTVVAVPASGSVFPIGVSTVTVTATDAYGNSSQTTFNITVADSQNPTVITKNITIQLDASGSATLSAAQIDNGSYDNTTIQGYAIDKTSFSCANVGANTVTLTVTDIYGNVGTATAIVTVEDKVAPVVVTKNITVALNASGSASVLASDIDNGSNDACGIASESLSATTFTCANLGVNTVTLTVTDVHGNVSTGLATVTVVDNIAPQFTSGATIITPNTGGVVTATSAAGAMLMYIMPTATDNCSNATVTAVPASGSVFAIGNTTVTVIATDNSGNSTQTSFVITVVGLAPVIVTPGNIVVNNDPGMNGAVVSFTATETTAIPASTITYLIAPGTFFAIGTTTVTATASNAVGNSSVNFTVTVIDNEKPTIATADNVSANNDENSCGALVATTAPSASDNAGIASVTGVRADGLLLTDAYPVGSTVITWTATDIYGNTNSSTQTITVTDNQLPTISAPAAVTVTADAGLCSASNVSLGNAVTADNCAVATTTNNAPAIFPVGTTTVTWTVTDIHGNVSTAIQTVTVNDTEKPSITTTDKTQTADAGVCQATVTIATPVTADNCGVASVTNSINGTSNASGVYAVGSTQITWTVTDIHGNVNTTVQNITVNDEEKPVALTQNITIQLDASGAASITPAQINNGSTDNCGIASITLDKTSFYCSNVGVNTVTLTVTDIHGNVSTATATVTVQDNIAPVAIAKNITLGLGTQVGGLVTITAADVNNGSSDACGIASMTVVPASFGCVNVGANTVTLTVTDVNGNVSTTTAVVTVVDDKGPVPTVLTLPVINGQCYATALTLKPGEHEEDHDGEDDDHEGDDDDDHEGIELDHYRLVAPTAMDNCSGLITGTTTDPLTYYNQGTYIIHWKFVDAKGNVTIQEQTVIVKDNIAPRPKYATLPVIKGECSVTIGGNGKGEKGEDKGNDDNDHSNGAWAKDNCSGWIKGTTTSPLTYTVQGTYTITWDYNDGHGNISHQLQTVIVKDVTAPKINAPKDKTVACGSSILPAVTGMATATDNCSTPVITFTDVNSGTQITRTWKATDDAGNTSTAVQLIKLTPAFSATVSSTPTSTVYTGGTAKNIYLGYGAQSTTLSVTGLPAGSYTYTWSGGSLSSNTSATPVFNATASGVYTFYVTVSNASGCSSTASISICVTDVRVPGSNGSLIYVCHQGSNKSGGTQTLSVPVAQVAAHLANSCGGKGGDRLGSCSSSACTTNTDISAVDPIVKEVIELKGLKADVSSAAPIDDIKVTVMPNPSTTYFTLKFESKDQKTPMSLRVMDASGRAIDSKQQIDPSSTIQIGHNYPSGTFYTEVIQGNRRKVVQLIKARG